MTEMAELAAAADVVGFADGQPLENLALLRVVRPQAFRKANWHFGLAIANLAQEMGRCEEGRNHFRFWITRNRSLKQLPLPQY